MADFVLGDFLPYQLSVLAAKTSAGFAQAYSREFGITVAEWRILAHLSQADEISIRDIHRQVEIDKSKASRAAARLVEAGFVRKAGHEGDRRLVSLSLTTAGRDLMVQIIPLARRFEAESLERLSPQDRKDLRRIFGILMEQRT